MPTIHNPILPGFNPDPSIVRVGDDYYIATSTFEWFPGTQIHHSRDLVDWRLIGHAQTDPKYLPLAGIENSAGIWAPSLSYHDDQFWLIYTIVNQRLTNFKDVHNYLVTAPTIDGPWSEPISLNASGFDPSLFHDDDGRKWLVNQQWDFRVGKPRFAGIVLQEYDHSAKSLIGPTKIILTKPGLIEGPNLYKIGGMYYLMLAEGGTGWNHSISMARSKSIDGPYEVDPWPALMTSRDDYGVALQKAGHGELVQTQSGEWYLVHLASRPVGPNRNSIMGRETCIQRVIWNEEGWLRLAQGGTAPLTSVEAPSGLAEHPWPVEPIRDHFDSQALSPHWASLRVPVDETWASLTERPGNLRLRGRESQHSLFHQSLVAKRIQKLPCVAETCVEFDPQSFMQSAGLICWYDTRTHYYLRITKADDGATVAGIVLTDDGNYNELHASNIDVSGWGLVFLRATINAKIVQFAVSRDGEDWVNVGSPLDATKLSDEYGQGLHFTGAFAGICAQDLQGTNAIADFDYFELA